MSRRKDSVMCACMYVYANFQHDFQGDYNLFPQCTYEMWKYNSKECIGKKVNIFISKPIQIFFFFEKAW